LLNIHRNLIDVEDGHWYNKSYRMTKGQFAKGGLQMGENMKFTDLDQYLFGQGTNYEVYKKIRSTSWYPSWQKGRIFCCLGT